uniref:Uncharacterized protein n=1 Tax=Lepeophtheirus salmonis TaxID=72036 RepID=A0A0K2TR89_LEPSM
MRRKRKPARYVIRSRSEDPKQALYISLARSLPFLQYITKYIV